MTPHLPQGSIGCTQECKVMLYSGRQPASTLLVGMARPRFALDARALLFATFSREPMIVATLIVPKASGPIHSPRAPCETAPHIPALTLRELAIMAMPPQRPPPTPMPPQYSKQFTNIKMCMLFKVSIANDVLPLLHMRLVASLCRCKLHA